MAKEPPTTGRVHKITKTLKEQIASGELPEKYYPGREVMYGVGFRTELEITYGMVAGPSPNIEEMLNVFPEISENETRGCYVLQFDKMGKTHELYQWNLLDESWDKLKNPLRKD